MGDRHASPVFKRYESSMLYRLNYAVSKEKPKIMRSMRRPGMQKFSAAWRKVLWDRSLSVIRDVIWKLSTASSKSCDAPASTFGSTGRKSNRVNCGVHKLFKPLKPETPLCSCFQPLRPLLITSAGKSTLL